MKRVIAIVLCFVSLLFGCSFPPPRKSLGDKKEIVTDTLLSNQVSDRKFGLTKEERKQVWKDKKEIDIKILKEAKDKFPPPEEPIKLSGVLSQEMLQKGKELNEYMDMLKGKYEKYLLEKYNITKEQFEEIVKECKEY